MVPWVASVRLQDVCFSSWEVPISVIRPRIPSELEVDTYDGKCFITAVALRGRKMRFRRVVPMPGGKDFLELNFRTYVRYRGERGIWWFSVDATPKGLFAWFASHIFHIPYHRSKMHTASDENGVTTFASAGRQDDDPSRYALSYAIGADEAVEPPRGSLEKFICDRDLAFASKFGRIWRLKVCHPAWRVQAASAICVDPRGLFDAQGFPVPTGAATAYFSPHSDVVMLPPIPTRPDASTRRPRGRRRMRLAPALA